MEKQGSVSEVYKRSNDLIKNYQKFINQIKNEDTTTHNISIKQLCELKSVLSNIHNVLTLIATLTATKKIAEALLYSEDKKKQLVNEIENKKANANGFDIEIIEDKVLAEVKCNVPIKSHKLGQQQINGVLNDARKLRNDPPKRKAKIKDTSEYIKLIVLVDFYTDKMECIINSIMKEVHCKDTTREERKERLQVKKYLKRLNSFNDMKNISKEERAYVYIVTITAEEMEQELGNITKNR